MKCAVFLAGVMTIGVAFAQDLPPGVLLLSRVKNHIREEVQRLENISCLETIEREHQPPRGKMQPLDTVRLEVLFNGDKELFASPGDRKFSEEHPISYVGSGVLGTGLFAGYLKDILLNESVSNEYKGEEEIGGRRLDRYEYRLPLMWSRHTIHLLEGSGTVGIHGSYWVDAQTHDVVRLELVADDIPPTLLITQAETSIDYAPTRVGNHAPVLLPQSADFNIAKFTGEVFHNRMEFTHCRVFSAEAKLSFGASDAAEEEPRFGISSVDDTLRTLPTGLEIAVKLRTPVSSDMAVGTLIDGIVAGDVSMKGKLVIAAGSPVRGRIRRMERYTDPFPYFVVALEFTEVQVEGIRYRFYADPVDIEHITGVEQKLWTKDEYEARSLFGGGGVSRQRKESLYLPNLPGVATFFFKGAKLDLPQGFRTVWKTRPLKR